MQEYTKYLKQKIKKLDKYHDGIVNIYEVFDIIDKVTNDYFKGKIVEEIENTEITYIYRDENNNKKWFTYVLQGKISEEQKNLISSYLFDINYGFFIPELVGLPDNGIKEKWFEWMFNSILPTNKEATINMTVNELVNNFKNAFIRDWNLESNKSYLKRTEDQERGADYEI